MPFSIETFVGLHIYLVAADLIYNILDKFMVSLYDNLLSPFVNMLLGDSFFSSLKWKIGKAEDDNVIDLGAIIAELFKLFFLALFAFYMYQYFKKYAKFNS